MDNSTKQFIEDHKIPTELLFDGEGMKKKDYRAAMKKCGAKFVYNTTPCSKAGHTLRTRAGHCVPCDPKKLSFMNRHHEDGYVYVAYSKTLDMVKIGLSKTAKGRASSLNSNRLGGVQDWEILLARYTDKAGVVETAAHRRVGEYRVPGVARENDGTVCKEVFNCTIQQAIRAVNNAVVLGV